MTDKKTNDEKPIMMAKVMGLCGIKTDIRTAALIIKLNDLINGKKEGEDVGIIETEQIQLDIDKQYPMQDPNPPKTQGPGNHPGLRKS